MSDYDPNWRRTDRITHKHELAKGYPEQFAKSEEFVMNKGKPDCARAFRALQCKCGFWHVQRGKVFIKQ